MSLDVPLDSIEVRERSRRDLRDIDTLAASIKARGLLHPPVVRVVEGGSYVLVAGARRLAALRLLDHDTVPVTVARDVTDELAALLAEGEENTERAEFLPSEAVAHSRRIEAAEKAAAKQRQAHGSTAPGRNAPANLAGASEGPKAGESRARVAKAVGKKPTSLGKARKVVDAAADTTAPEPVRQAAKQALADMDRTGKVDPAHKAVTLAEKYAVAVTEFPDLTHYADRQQKAVDLAATLRGCDEMERDARIETLRLSIAADKRRGTRPPPPAPTPDHYSHVSAMFAAATDALAAIRKHGGVDTVHAAMAGTDRPTSENWADQFRDLAEACHALADACKPSLRRVQ